MQEAVSIVSIAAILVGVGCYCAAVNHVPLLSLILFWIATQVYQFFPALNRLNVAQAPMLVAAAAVGIAFFILAIPLAPALANVFSRAGISNLDRQTFKLQKQRASIKKTKRDRNEFVAD
jgi:hypothetical protein